jgi:hypothetical protein
LLKRIGRAVAEQLFSAKGWRVTTTTHDDSHRLVVHVEPTRNVT